VSWRARFESMLTKNRPVVREQFLASLRRGYIMLIQSSEAAVGLGVGTSRLPLASACPYLAGGTPPSVSAKSSS